MIRDHLVADAAMRAIAAARRRWTALASIGQAVGQVLSTLDDRDPLTALRVLEPARALEEGARCTRCITRGE